MAKELRGNIRRIKKKAKRILRAQTELKKSTEVNWIVRRNIEWNR